MVRTSKLLAFSSLLCVILFVFPTIAKAAYGDWTIYAAYHHASKVAVLNNKVFVLSDNGLYSYDPEDTSIETYDKTNSLSDNHIFDMVRCDATKLIVLLYRNGNIDLLDSKGNAYNMPELKAKPLPDKTMNSMYVNNEFVYVSTNSGIVVLDTKRKVFTHYYDFGVRVNDVVVHDDAIMAVTPNGVFKGELSTNLLDASNWKKISDYNFSKIMVFNDTYYVCTMGTSPQLRVVTNKNNFGFKYTTDDVVKDYCIADDKLFYFGDKHTLIFDKDGNYKTIDNDLKTVHAEYVGNKFWMACNTNGLLQSSFDGDLFKQTVSSIIPNSPFYNYFYKLRLVNNRLLSVGGFFEFSSSSRIAFATQFENGVWTTFDENSAYEGVGGDFYYRNYHDIIQDPDDPNHHFVGAKAGLIEYRNYKFEKQYTHKNAGLTSIIPTSSHANYYVWISGFNYDSQKNLWMLNSQVDTIIKVMKPNGEWFGYYCPEIANHSIMGDLMFDSQRGWIWANSHFSSSVNNGGLFVLDTNGTINQRSDDRSRFIYIFNNQDGQSYHIDNLHCIVEDLNGAIWIGTDLGPFVTYEPSTIFNQDFYFTQCKVPRNDGTNYADYLLGEVEVRCIAIDGGNRKWMGTAGNGLYLVSADGTEILEHFTVDNSPLISNDIFSIAIDGSSGEVFIATENGLVSYMSNAVDPEESFDKDIVKAYPNPVRPDYTGKIIITGLMQNSVVKIVNAAGRLVKEGTSVGGEFTWDRLTNEGKQAASGVYYVLATDSEGDKGVATKFLIVK